MNRAARYIAALAALAGWAGLALQLGLMVSTMGATAALWRFVGFFTILANIGAATVGTAIAFGSRGALAKPRARLMAASSIIVVGLVYTLALRSLWNPVGWQKLADVALHDATPLLWLLLWIVAPPARLRWREMGWALAPPLLYLIYALIRGSADGWYAYWFLDPTRQAAGELLASMALILCAFAVVSEALIAVSRCLAGPRRGRDIYKQDREWSARVDEAGRESFPASDPPGWTLGPDRPER